jgi:hypothetical protein
MKNLFVTKYVTLQTLVVSPTANFQLPTTDYHKLFITGGKCEFDKKRQVVRGGGAAGWQ